MGAFEELLIWAKDQGIELDGVEPRRIPGRGFGVIATRDLKVRPPNPLYPSSSFD